MEKETIHVGIKKELATAFVQEMRAFAEYGGIDVSEFTDKDVFEVGVGYFKDFMKEKNKTSLLSRQVAQV